MTALSASGIINPVDEASRVHVVVRHPMMRELVIELLAVAGDDECRVITTSVGQTGLPDPPVGPGDVVIVDESAWGEGMRREVSRSGASVLVVAAEDDPSSREISLNGDAAAWLPRARLGEELSVCVERLLAEHRQRDEAGRSQGSSQDRFG